MTKKLVFLAAFILLTLTACNELKKIAGDMAIDSIVSNDEVARGLKEALNFGIGKGADVLSKKDGYYKSAYKILLPTEARKVTDKLKNIPGFNQVEDIVLEKINRGAEDAATKAKPIFVDAIKAMTFKDALNILMGNENAATDYLRGATYDKLYQQFNPTIVTSLNKFNAIKYWEDAVGAYNKIPLVNKVTNTRLDDYVTKEALNGLFKMVAGEEKSIRTDKTKRTTDLLRKVFAKQDKK